MDKDITKDTLLAQFNSRDIQALKRIYLLYYDELHYYAYKLYKNTSEDFSDAVHDVFLNLWCTKMQFETLENIKAYLYIALRNHFRRYSLRNLHLNQYQQTRAIEAENTEMEISRSEIYAYLQSLFRLLPPESAEILRLSLDNFEVDEIAQKLGKSKQTIYNKKSEAIKKLREYIKKEEDIKLILCFLRTPKFILTISK